jgi:tetratricopeptide (TPR) repeat protein
MRISTLGKSPCFQIYLRSSGLLSLANHLASILTLLLVFCLSVLPVAHAGQERGQTPDISIVPKPINDTADAILIRNAKMKIPGEQKAAEVQDSCLLPPLTRLRSPLVAASTLAVPAKAKKEYFAACAALQEKKTDSAEKHLRKAVQIYPKYSTAWVTLGQMLAAQNNSDEARHACAEGSTVEPNYVPAFLCLAELAARAKAWYDVLQFSNRAIQLDPVSTAIAYEYNAAANLRTNKLDDAEKSALRALAIDKDNHEPRLHFVLAQIYEAKGDRPNEIAQLKEYLKFADNPDDVAMVKQYLSQLDGSEAGRDDLAAQRQPETLNSSSERTAEEGRKAGAPRLSETSLNGETISERSSAKPRYEDLPPGCNLEDVLPQVERRIEEFADNVQKFTATESLVHESFNGSGHVARAERAKYDYIVAIDESIPGILQVNEHQYSHSSSEAIRANVVTKGLPALLLIFHPLYAGDFSMVCEGLVILKGSPAWQIRFQQRANKPNRIRSYQIGATGPAYEVNLEGRAWFTADSYQIVKLEADLIKAIPEIQLTIDHTSAEYGPVHFRSRGIDLWLPQTADFVSERNGKRLHERIVFGDYLLFAVDNKQEIAAPKPQEWLTGSALCGMRGWCDRRQLLSTDSLISLRASPSPD